MTARRWTRGAPSGCWVQPDLFGAPAPLTPVQQRHRDALVCLRDVCPDSLRVVHHLDWWSPRDDRCVSMAAGWVWTIGRAGIRAQHQGWAPARHLVTWPELAEHLGGDPRRAAVTTWVHGLPDPSWQRLRRPTELGPDPHQWHRRYLCRDHLDPHWPGRRHAWQLVLDLLGDAIARLDEGVAG